MLWESDTVLCVIYVLMYLHGLSTPSPQWGTSWCNRRWWPAGSRRRTWCGSLWTVWSWGSSYSSTSRPLSRSSRPAAQRTMEKRERGGKNITISVSELSTLLLAIWYRYKVFTRYSDKGGPGFVCACCSHICQLQEGKNPPRSPKYVWLKTYTNCNKRLVRVKL